MTFPSVAHTAEFQRVSALPRRVWGDGDLARLASEMTDILRTPSGEQALFPMQAVTLYEAGIQRGVFGGLGTGDGKTIPTLLLPLVVGARKPLLLLPGGLVEKTQRERLAYSRHWRVPNELRIYSYDLLSRVENEHELDSYAPDLIICDEAHRLKNKRAAVTRRVARYMHHRPETMFAALSGSFMDLSLKEFAHILIWSLKLGAPVPSSAEEIEEWAEALDHGVDPFARRRAGALLEFCSPEELRLPDDLAARRAFRRRLIETPGVVMTQGDGEHVGASIHVRSIRYDVKPITDIHMRKLRADWQTPDGWQLMFAPEMWMHAQQMALGLYYAWDPRPPDDWRDARRTWHKFVRETIARGRTFDSEKHVANAVSDGRLKAGRAQLERWRQLEPTFTPNVVPVWFDDSALRVCADWMKRPGVVWTEHSFFAARLASMTGAPYYGAGGFTAEGRYIEDAPAGSSVIASIDANREGKNLQRLWDRMLFVSPPARASWIEQAVARLHRPGQTAEAVHVDVLLGCREHFDSIVKAIAAAGAIQDMTGKRQKILRADVVLPSEFEIEALKGPRWQKVVEDSSSLPNE